MEAAEALKLTELINKEKKYTKKFRLLNANPPEDPWEVERRRRAEAAAVAPPPPEDPWEVEKRRRAEAEVRSSRIRPHAAAAATPIAHATRAHRSARGRPPAGKPVRPR